MSSFHWLQDLVNYLEKHYKRTLYTHESIINYNFDSYIEQRQSPSFSQKLLYILSEKDLDDPEVYKGAGIDRKHFSKIRSNPSYQPKKKTAFALCLSLRLDLSEAETLLRSAGYSFSSSQTLDLVVQYCIEHKIYDLQEVNYALNHYGLDHL